VADTANNRIQVFSSNGSFITMWGGYGEINGSFTYPQGIAVDPTNGNVYVADTGNNRIQVFSSNGTFQHEFGSFGIINSSFHFPQGIAVDPSTGNVYVADTGNNRIQVFSSNGSFITRLGGYGTINGTLRSPTDITLDQQGNVYVADTVNSRIQVFSSNGSFITMWGGYGTINGTLRSPTDITLDQQGNVYVADTGNNRIQVFSSNGSFITEGGRYGVFEGHLRSPQGIAVDPTNGNVYVADTGNNRISVITSHAPINPVAFSSEEGEIYGDDTHVKIEPVYEGLKLPTSIAFLGPNDMLVLQKENNTITRIVNGQMFTEPVLDLGSSVEIYGCACDLAILQDDNGTSSAFLYLGEVEVTEEDGTTKVVNSLYRYDVTSDGEFTNPVLLFEMPSSHVAIHHGGKVMIGPDKNVYITTGDVDGRNTRAQNIKNGSLPDGSSGILRFTPNGEPVDGGLLGDSHPLDKYYAYGIRNSFGIDYDPVTGNIWMTDNGPDYGDELNLVMPGFNGGWKKVMGMSYLTKGFNTSDLEDFGGTGKYYDPQFEWRGSLGITDVVFLASDRLGEQYENNLFVGDVNHGHLYRFLLNESRTGLSLDGSLSNRIANNDIEVQQAVFAKLEGGITDLEVGPDGLLYIVTINGKILRLEPTLPPEPSLLSRLME
jgi:aldose sugar dehydrogenase